MSRCLLQLKGLSTVTTESYFPFSLGAHHSSQVGLCPAELSKLHHVRVGTAWLLSRAGDGFQRAVLLKKQCLCFGGRAKCCLFPDAFLGRRQAVQLLVIHAVTETGWGQHSEEMTKLIQAWGHDAIFCPWLKGTQFASLDGTCFRLPHCSVSMTASATPSPDHLRFQNFFWLLHGNVSIVSCSFSHTVPSDWGKYSQVAQTVGSGEKLYQLDSCLEQFNLCLSLDGSLLQDSLHYNNTY